jgi:hypothetical protein
MRRSRVMGVAAERSAIAVSSWHHGRIVDSLSGHDARSS